MEPWLSWNKLCRPAWPQIHCNLPASEVNVLGLNVCTIMSGISMCLFNSNIIFWIDFHFNNCYVLRRLFTSFFCLIVLIISILNFSSLAILFFSFNIINVGLVTIWRVMVFYFFMYLSFLSWKFINWDLTIGWIFLKSFLLSVGKHAILKRSQSDSKVKFTCQFNRWRKDLWQSSFSTKVLKKFSIEGSNIVKAIFDKYIGSIIVLGEKLKVVPQNSAMKQMCPFLSFFNIILYFLARAIRP